MGARLRYAKVIDREEFIVHHGGKLHPGLENGVVMDDEPGTAGAFLVLRAWNDDKGTFTEQWRIETPGGTVVYKGTPRELHLPTTSHTEQLEDEVADLKLDYAAEDYNVVFLLDEREVARISFPVRATEPEGSA